MDPENSYMNTGIFRNKILSLATDDEINSEEEDVSSMMPYVNNKFLAELEQKRNGVHKPINRVSLQNQPVKCPLPQPRTIAQSVSIRRKGRAQMDDVNQTTDDLKDKPKTKTSGGAQPNDLVTATGNFEVINKPDIFDDYDDDDPYDDVVAHCDYVTSGKPSLPPPTHVSPPQKSKISPKTKPSDKMTPVPPLQSSKPKKDEAPQCTKLKIDDCNNNYTDTYGIYNDDIQYVDKRKIETKNIPGSNNREKKGYVDCCRVNRMDKVACHDPWKKLHLIIAEGLMAFSEKENASPNECSTLKNAEVFLDVRSKRPIIKIQCSNGVSYSLTHKDHEVTGSWYEFIKETIQSLKKKNDYLKQASIPTNLRQEALSSVTAIQQQLVSFFKRRVTKQELQQRGIYKEPTFGGTLELACSVDGSPGPPTFLRICLQEIEKRGLHEDGIYRKSGTQSAIQDLRIRINQGSYSFDHVKEVHTLTGAVKLYFRELSCPLLSSSNMDAFIRASNIKNTNDKRNSFNELISSLPKVHKNTLHTLVKHLRKVIENERSNRMSLKNISLIFGPTLMWKEVNCGNELGSILKSQVRVVECILELHDSIFK